MMIAKAKSRSSLRMRFSWSVESTNNQLSVTRRQKEKGPFIFEMGTRNGEGKWCDGIEYCGRRRR